jgi:hypothetical protein
MARIRTIKPEFPQSESMGRVSREARLCFVLLWTICDDSGRTRASSRMLASLLYPYDDDAGKRIDGWLTELETENCIVRYEIEGNTYLEVRNWLNHQRIDKPSASKIPPFAEASRILANPREASCEEGKGKEGKGKERNGRERTLAEPSLPPVEGLDAAAWKRWLDYRAEIRKPLKPASHQAAMTALARYGAQQSAVVDQSISNGWQGLFDLKPGATIAATTKPPMPPMFIDGVFNLEHKAWAEKWA